MTKSQTQTIAERIHDPIHRVAYSFRREGGSLWVSTWLEDGGHLPEHFHPSLEEHWEALEGTVKVKLDGTWRDLRPEDGRVTVAPGVRHELENASGREVSLRAEVIPGGRLEEFLTESARAAREGLFMKGGIPKSLKGARWAAAFLERHRDEVVMTFPPPLAQRAMIALLAR